MNIPDLFQLRNQCLQQFLKLSEKFLIAARSGDFTRVSIFHVQREALIKMLEYFEERIRKKLREPDREKTTEGDREILKQELKILDETLKKIQAVDQEIMALIEKETKSLQEEISQQKKEQSTLKKFRSAKKKLPGGGLDQSV